MNGYIILLIAALICILIGIFIGIVYLKIKQWKKAKKAKEYGTFGERVVLKKLKKIGMFRKYRILSDFYFPLHDGATQIDHLLIGSFGILIIEVKNYAGVVYGTPSEKEWLHISHHNRHKFYNPIWQNKAHEKSVRDILAKEKIYNLSVFTLVVFSNKKVQLNIPKKMDVIKINKLRKELRKKKYRVHTDICVKELENIFKSYFVTDKKTKKKHLKEIKKK